MELGQDWGALNRILYPRKKTKGSSASEYVFIAHHSDRAFRILGDQDELLFATGAPLAEALNAISPGHKAVTADVAELDRALVECLKTEGGIYDQIATLRQTLSLSKGRLPALPEHFALKAVRTWWGKFLPSSFGVYLHLEETGAAETKTAGENASLLLIFRKGELSEFDEPDFSSISSERREDLSEKVKVLRERHGVPVQGFAMNRADFVEWTEIGADPRQGKAVWKKIAKALRQDRLQLVPFRFSITALIGSRGIF
jgi:hypothetical protein